MDEIWYYILVGFIAQIVDGALGMAYGLTATSFLSIGRGHVGSVLTRDLRMW